MKAGMSYVGVISHEAVQLPDILSLTMEAI